MSSVTYGSTIMREIMELSFLPQFFFYGHVHSSAPVQDYHTWSHSTTFTQCYLPSTHIFFLFPLIISIIFQTYTLLFFPLCTCALATCLLAFCYFLIQESYGTCFTNDIYKHIYNPSINDSSRSIQVSGSGNVANEKQPSMRLYHHHQLTSPVLSWNFSAKDSIFS